MNFIWQPQKANFHQVVGRIMSHEPIIIDIIDNNFPICNKRYEYFHNNENIQDNSVNVNSEDDIYIIDI